MNLSDITKINFGSAGISAVYNGGIKLWPKQVVTDNKVMKFTIVSGDTWNKAEITAYTADNKYIAPVKKDATGWTYDKDVAYIKSGPDTTFNLLTFEGFPNSVKLKSGIMLFYSNSKCTDISTTNLDVSECTSMSRMFGGCGGLTSLDVSNFNTSKVTDMNNMFYKCSGLTSIDLSNFDTSKVTDMRNMFYQCNGLTSLDLSNFNTSQVTKMSGMFIFCSKLTALNLSNFDTSQVTDMGSMFYSCRGLTSLDLSNWDTSKVTSMSNMFNSCTSLKTVKMTNCSQATKDKIRAALDAAGLTSVVITE